MEETVISYKGHRIALAVTVIDRKTFGWDYQIDGGAIVLCRDEPASTEQMALDAGLAEAKRTIDRRAAGRR